MADTKKNKENRVKKILMDRDGISAESAERLISDCRQALHDGEWDAISFYLGLEDDYIFDII